MTALIVTGVLCAAIGFVGAMANQIAGLGLIGIACFCALLARIAQASTASAKSTVVPERTAGRHIPPAA